MCYLVVERYSVCKCLYYQHAIDMCSKYGTKLHPIQERTVLVGYACDKHSNYQQPPLPWSSGYSGSGHSTGLAREHINNSKVIDDGDQLQGVKITSAVALRALEDAQWTEDAYTERLVDSIMDTVSTQTTVETDSFHGAKAQGMSNHPSNLNDLRERLRNPKEYVISLQELEENTWSNSTISMYTSLDQDHSRPNLYKKTYESEEYISYPLIPSELQDVIPNRLSDDPFQSDPTNTSDEQITALCKSATDCTASAHLSAIRMCRNIILRTFLNLKSLQKSNFCAGSFSIIVLDKTRLNVAKLLPIEDTDFIALAYELEYILRDSASWVLNPRGSKSPLDIDRRFGFLSLPMVKQYCESLLQMDEGSPQVFDLGIVNILRFLILTLDLAVASYSGAHCSDFLNDTLSADEAIPLLAPFLDCSDALKKSSVTFKRCKLQCLDTFHAGRAAWVFCPPNCEPSLPLCISATIDCFSDIWGPLWKLKDQGNLNKYSSYVVGNGAIVQWKHNPSTDPKLAGERFCHWIHNEELEDDAQDTSSRGTNLPDVPFDGTEKLLIGASWTPNPACSPSVSTCRRRLQEAGRLVIVGASKTYHYNDSNQYQLQVGYSGVNVSATRQYKRIPGQSLKEILIELWAMEPNIRDPRLLEDLHGVEISMCTYNAQRVSLSQILRSNCMRHLLRDFSWGDPEYRTEHFSTLEHTLRPKRLQDPQFKGAFDYAVMLGLKMLSKTGVDRQDNLRVFLSSKCTPKPELATMVSKEHSWIGLLKDTTTECAMVAFGDECLGFNCPMGVSCGRAGCSALRSAMILHSSVRQTKLSEDRMNAVQTETQGWDTSKVPIGQTFSLGERGNLRLIARVDNGLLVGWSPHSVKMAVRSRLGREPVHREYTELDHSGEGSVARPLPIFVLSDK